MGSDIFLIKEECRVVRIITLIVVAALGETVTLIIETENKDLITSAMKLEKLPVIFEEITEKDLTRFIIRLK